MPPGAVPKADPGRRSGASPRRGPPPAVTVGRWARAAPAQVAARGPAGRGARAGPAGARPAGLDTRLVGRSTGHQALDVRAARGVVAGRDAEVGAVCMCDGAAADQLVRDVDHLVARDREADVFRRLARRARWARRLAVTGGERRDPDHLAGDVDESPTGVAWVDSRGGLDGVGQRDAVALRLRAAGSAHDA